MVKLDVSRGAATLRPQQHGSGARMSRIALLALCACCVAAGYVAACLGPLAALPLIKHTGADGPVPAPVRVPMALQALKEGGGRLSPPRDAA
jgi:hypothetical protein